MVRELSGRETKPVLSAPGAIDTAQLRVYGARPEPSFGKHAVSRPDLPPPTQAERRRAELLARHAGLEFAGLELEPDGSDPVDHEAARRLQGHVCRTYRVLPVAAEIGRLVVAVDDPFDTERQQVVFALTAQYPRVVVAAARELDRAIARVFGTMR